ncbi:MAG: IS4 family transposase [Chloroflexi bacterium]|nr:IS4 family transposase [Chloroflexota bacterium]
MQSLSQIEEALKYVMEERARVVARETGCIQRERKFDGASLLQMLVFGWLAHPDASLEHLVSTVAARDVLVSDTAVHNRFTESCARFLHAVLQELTQVVVRTDQDVPLELLRRFSNVIIEDSSSIALPDELAEIWQGCGGPGGQGQAVVKVHVRWELKRGQIWGPSLTHGRTCDRSSPFNEDVLPEGSLYAADLGYFNLDRMVQRRAQKSYTLTRPQSSTAFFTTEGKRLHLKSVLPQRVGQSKEMAVLVGVKQHHPMRLLMMRVPPEVAEQRRARLILEATRLQRPVSEQALELTQWLLLLTDAPAKRLSLQEAIVLLRERWQIEILYKLWKHYGQIDEWLTANTWRILCEFYAKLIGVLLQHWLIVLFAWQDELRSLVKLAQVIRDGSLSFIEAFAGYRSLHDAIVAIARRMRAGCQMNKRKKHPNSAQLLRDGLTAWVFSP